MITTFSISQLPNPMHLQFMDYVVTLVGDKNPTTLSVKPQFDLLSQRLTELKELYKLVQGSPITEKITEADTLRDQLLTGIMKIVEGNTCHFDPAMVTCATLLQKNIRVYGWNMARNDWQTETAKIESLVNDWRTKTELSNAVDMLGILDWVIELENCNNEFKRLYTMRTEEFSHKTDETMITKRTEVNFAYNELCKWLNSYSVINTSNPSYEIVCSGINSLIDQYSTLLKQRRTHKTTTVTPSEN